MTSGTLHKSNNCLAVEKFASFEKALKCLTEIRPGDPYSVLSFDVFDTLIFRRCHPEAVVEGVSRWLSEECLRSGIELRCDAVTAREHAYQQLAAANQAEGFDPDCSLTHLCRRWVEELAGEPWEELGGLAEAVEHYEVALEQAVCYANTPCIELLRGLKEKGFRLIYVSDMYLGHHVGGLLDACGFAGIFDCAYVSGDVARLKRTGALFTYVLSSEGISPAEMLHVGDNPINDGTRAVEQGIAAYVIRDKQEVRRYHALEFDWRYVKRDPSYAGAVAAGFATAPMGEHGSFAETVGMRLLGPVYAAFLHGVVDRCAAEKINNIFFVAREGSVLKDMFCELAPLAYRDGNSPRANYIGFSRHTALLYAMNDLGLREMSKIGLNTAHHSLRNVLAALRVPEDTLLAAAASSGIEDIDAALPEYYLHWGPFHQVMRTPAIRLHIDSLMGRSKPLIDKYLEQRGLFHQPRAALIDVGWNAQIQENLYFGMLDRPDRPQLFGFYLGTMERAHWTRSAHNIVEGLVVDESKACWHAHAAFEFVPVLEACVRAPHGTVIDHSESSFGEITPVFKPETEKSRQAEMRDEVTIAQLQTGMRSYATQYRVAAQLFGFAHAQMVPYAQSVVDRLVRFPTRKEALLFLPMNNVSDLGSDLIAPLSQGLLDRAIWKAWLRLPAVLYRSSWRYGALAVLGLRFLQPVYAILFRLRTPAPFRAPSPAVYAAPKPTSFDEYRDGVWQGHPPTEPVRPQPYETELKVHEQALADMGRNTAEPVALRSHTLPLTLSEAGWEWFTGKVAGAVWLVFRGQGLQKDGTHWQPLLYREIYSRYPMVCRTVARTGGFRVRRVDPVRTPYPAQTPAPTESLQSV